MRRTLEHIPAVVLTQAYVLSLLAARLLGDAETELAPLLASVAVSGLFLALLLLRARQVGPILSILFAVAAVVAIVPMATAVFAIVLVVPATLVYLACAREPVAGR